MHTKPVTPALLAAAVLTLTACANEDPTAPADNATWHLSWARPAGTWHTFGRLTLHADAGPPTPFDPINGLPTGLSQYDVVARLRNPAYIRAAMQRSSPAGSPHHAAELD